MNGFLWGVLSLMVMFLGAALGDLVSEEIRGWLDRVPRAVLKLAALRLDPADRETTYREVWGPDLDYFLARGRVQADHATDQGHGLLGEPRLAGAFG